MNIPDVKGINDGEVNLAGAIKRILPAQDNFLTAGEKFAAYMGGFGSGKTIALCCCAIMNGNAEPNGFSLIGRLHKPALEMTTRKTFLELFPADWVADWVPSKGWLKAKNGHEYLFTHLDLADAEIKAHIRSLNLSAFYVDEAPEISEQTYLTLVGRLRRQGVSRRCGRLSGNPAGQDWIWRLFFDEKRPEKLKRIHKGILAPTTENVNLPPGYIDDMICVYPDDWVERYIYGSFADFSDKVYKDFNSNIHCFDCENEYHRFNRQGHPPKEWPVIVGIDIGGVDPWHIVFIAVEPETGFLYAFAEFHRAGVLVREIADEFYLLLDDRPMEGMAYDYENQQAAMELAYEGPSGSPANKDVAAGIFKVAQYLHPDPRLQHPFLGGNPSPRFFACSRCCPQTVRSLAGVSWDKDRSGNPTGKVKHDEYIHGADAVRYAIHTFRPEPRKIKPRPVWENPQLDMLSRMFWRDYYKMKEKGYIDPHERVFGKEQRRIVPRHRKSPYSWGKMRV